jgi:hypothetical protein
MSARPILVLALPLLLGAAPAGAARAPRPEPTPAPAVEAARAPAPVAVDGRLDDEAWASVPAFTDFTQRDPEEGQPATERTELRLLYDDDALYVGARLLDTEPDRIVKRLSRRDESAEADRFSIYLDPRRDRLTGVRFEVSAAGVQNDEIIYNDTWMDDSWDAVWLSAVHHDEQGWSVEMRIPFSELRFLPGDSQTWGVNASRYIQRKNESDWLALAPTGRRLPQGRAPVKACSLAVAHRSRRPGRHETRLFLHSGRRPWPLAHGHGPVISRSTVRVGSGGEAPSLVPRKDTFIGRASSAWGDEAFSGSPCS